MSENIGKVVQVMGPVLDIRFEEGQLPKLLSAIEIRQDGKTLTLEVAQLIGDNDLRRHGAQHPAHARLLGAAIQHIRIRPDIQLSNACTHGGDLASFIHNAHMCPLFRQRHADP